MDDKSLGEAFNTFTDCLKDGKLAEKENYVEYLYVAEMLRQEELQREQEAERRRQEAEAQEREFWGEAPGHEEGFDF